MQEIEKAHEFIFRGHRVKYFTSGRGLPVVFLHNGGNDHHIWDYQLSFFASGYTVYALDLPGYGLSDKPDIEYTLDFYVRMLGEFIRSLKLENPVLVGNCVGSAISLCYAIENPREVRALLLFNILTHSTLGAGVFGMLLRLTEMSRIFTLITALIAARMIAPRFTRGIFFRLLYASGNTPEPGFLEVLNRCYDNRDQLRSLYSLVKNMKGFRFLDGYVRRNDLPPLCVIWGRGNKILPARAGEKLCSVLKPDETHVLDWAGHMVMREKKEEVNALMVSFIQKLQNRSGRG